MATLEDLTAQDSGLLGVVGPEGIDTTKKLKLAQEELGVELAALLPRVGVGLEHIVVTTPLRMWQVFRTLEMIYRDAYYSQLNDRYKGRQEEYRKLARWAEEKLLEAGLGIAADPVPRPEMPQVTDAIGDLQGGTYYVCTAWVNAAGEEGAASEWNSVAITGGGAITVIPGSAPPRAQGWNLYAGLSAEEMWRQNEAPLALGTWTWAGPLVAAGYAPGNGQAPSYTRSLPRILQRG
jgi:hypothetical protein